MSTDQESWILMVTARAPTNIAVIKYWGKREETLILPINDSISVTLDPDHLSATTTVAVSPTFEGDRMWLNGKEISLSGGRFQNCLREIRNRAEDFEDEKKGVRIRKEDWGRLHVHIASYNNFPTAAGLASSAAGFACFVFSLAKLMNVKDDLGPLSAIARQGSGSACRSLFGGFVKWKMGNEANGSDSLAVQLTTDTHWKDLVIIIAVVSSRQKETSSTTGMRETVETSTLLRHRAKVIVPSRILQMEEAIRNRDFKSFAQLTCADSNQFHAVCLDTSPPIFYMNDTSHGIINLVERWNRSEGTPQVAYTFDAGPNAVMIAPNRKVASLLLQRLLFYFPPPTDTALASYVLGDKSIMHEAGVQSLKDIDNLQPPPEIKDKAPVQRSPGYLSYFICTKSGRGPMLLAEDQALINSETGLPKYLAPEYVEYGIVYVTTGVCAFGIVLFQLISGGKVLDENRGQFQHLLQWAEPLVEKLALHELIDLPLENLITLTSCTIWLKQHSFVLGETLKCNIPWERSKAISSFECGPWWCFLLVCVASFGFETALLQHGC